MCLSAPFIFGMIFNGSLKMHAYAILAHFWILDRMAEENVECPKMQYNKNHHFRTENIENIRRARKFTSPIAHCWRCFSLSLSPASFFFSFVSFLCLCIWLQSILVIWAKRFHLFRVFFFFCLDTVPHVYLIKIDWTICWEEQRVATDAAKKNNNFPNNRR